MYLYVQRPRRTFGKIIVMIVLVVCSSRHLYTQYCIHIGLYSNNIKNRTQVNKALSLHSLLEKLTETVESKEKDPDKAKLILQTDKNICMPISIRGERHSGTNLLRSVISQRCKCSPWKINATHDMDGIFGWKHGTFNIHQKCYRNHLFIIVYRRADSWIQHMARDTFEAKYYKNGIPMNASSMIRPLLSEEFPPNYKNALHMRTTKYQNWHNYALKCPSNVVEITYESFVKNNNILLSILQIKKVLCDMQHPNEERYVSRSKQQNVIPSISKSNLQKISMNTNLTLENEIGLIPVHS